MRGFTLILLLAGVASVVRAADDRTGFREPFADIDHWEPLTFPSIDRHTDYTIEQDGTNHVLKATSDRSASGLVSQQSFDATRYPRLRWRWKIGHVMDKGDATRKDGCDFPMRIAVMFEYKPGMGGLAMRARNRLIKSLYGEYPPFVTLNYIWANRSHDARILTSPYADETRFVIVRAGTNGLGRWFTEEANILEDYREAFGEAPTTRAAIGVMSDSDNTGQSAEAWVDYIEVLK